MSVASGNSTVYTKERMRKRRQTATWYYCTNGFNAISPERVSGSRPHFEKHRSGVKLEVAFTVRGSEDMHVPHLKGASHCLPEYQLMLLPAVRVSNLPLSR